MNRVEAIFQSWQAEPPHGWHLESPGANERQLRWLHEQGLTALIADADRSQRSRVAPLSRRLLAEARRQAALEVHRRNEMEHALRVLGKAGIPTLVLKGGGLAYCDYPRPFLRPRDDTDLLVPPGDWNRAQEALLASGYQNPPSLGGGLVSAQRTFVRERGGVHHAIDLHVRPFNPHAVADVLGWEELAREARSVPGLGVAARTPSRLHALLLACVHLSAHHAGRERLIWLYDLCLLADSLDAEETERFRSLATERGVRALCEDALTRAADRFGSECLHALLAVRAMPPLGREEPSRRLLMGKNRRWQVLRSDFTALRGSRQRLRWLREHLFPPPAYMRERFDPERRRPLALLYAQRILRGTHRLLSQDAP